MTIKLINLCSLFAIALGFTLPEDNLDDRFNELPFEGDSVVLVRNARSPQGRLEAGALHSDRDGSSASVKYSHPLNDNLEVYGEASRNFRYNDNAGRVGLSYSF